MFRRLRDITPLLAVLVLALPAAAQAQDGPTGGAEAADERPALEVRSGALLDRALTIRGRTHPGDAGYRVSVQLRDLAGGWGEIATAEVDGEGTFRTRWKATVPGRLTLRAIVDRPDQSASAASEPLVAQVTVYKPAVSSWYGPGFFGRQTACGQRLTRKTVGVAHKSLPCGTQVDFFYKGRTLTVPVIDRGPFIAGRTWDLTQAAAEQLGVTATVTVGALTPNGAMSLRRKREQSLRSR
jgi:hypothetical protein